MLEVTVAPKVGMPATYAIGSDRYSAEVVAIRRNGKSVEVKLGYGWSEFFTLRGDGAWRLKGLNCGRLYLGYAQDYRDPSF